MASPPSAVFVYGTLKRGEVRARSWPRLPLKVDPATVRGTLFDLEAYPALVEGNQIVAGELWHFAPDDIPETLAVLDMIE
jgi:gamma-glutamylcyclotransferase (GGCT)/AIG2-like uncharacterized protein YtfP